MTSDVVGVCFKSGHRREGGKEKGRRKQKRYHTGATSTGCPGCGCGDVISREDQL